MKLTLINTRERPCRYFGDRPSRLQLLSPGGELSPDELDQILEQGMHVDGRVLLYQACATCDACETVRVDVNRFEPSRTQRRILKYNDPHIEVRVTEPRLTDRRLELFNSHRLTRNLARNGKPLDAATYHDHYVQSVVDTREVQYWLEGKLVGVTLLDFGRKAVCGRCHYFDVGVRGRSLGIFSKLKEMELVRAHGRRWFYLGHYVAGYAKLEYLGGFRPQQRRRAGVWTDVG